MSKFWIDLTIAFRNLVQHTRRTLFLGGAIAAVTMLLILMTGLSTGVRETMIESATMRMHGHAAHDNAWYVPKPLLDQWKKKDPIIRFEKLLSTEGVLTQNKKSSMMEEIQKQVEEATKIALEAPYAPGKDAAEGVYAE